MSLYKTLTPGSITASQASSSAITAIASRSSNPQEMKMMAVMVMAALVMCAGMVSLAEGRAMLDIGKLIDHLEGHCPPPPSDAAPAPYSEPSPAPAEYEPPPYYASPSPVDASPASPGSYQPPPAPTGGY